MTALRLRRHFILAMARHLPPGSSQFRLLDLSGGCAIILQELRGDLRPLRHDQCQTNSMDAIVACDLDLTPARLRDSLDLLRPGGRFIAVQTSGAVKQRHGALLEQHGFVRILLEPAVDGLGVLIRGEKAHHTDDTQARIQSVASADYDSLDLTSFRGRSLHLLIQRQPNKPAWAMRADERITWRAAAIDAQPQPAILAFSSLPKAVAFMQPLALAGVLRDINKVGKFSRETARSWSWHLRVNPAPESLDGERIVYIDIDPATAEAPDE